MIVCSFILQPVALKCENPKVQQHVQQSNIQYFPMQLLKKTTKKGTKSLSSNMIPKRLLTNVCMKEG